MSPRMRVALRRPSIEPDAFGPPGPLPVKGMWGPPSHGELNGSAKLTEAKVVELRKLKALGWTYPALAKRYGISRATVGAVLSGRTWGHVPG